MSDTPSGSGFAAFTLDADGLTRSAINGIRVGLGISGAVALVIGLLITFWPKGSAAVIVVLLGIYFVVAGIAYLGIGIFAKGIGGGARALDIILGILMIVAGILVFTDPQASAVILGIFLGIFVGIAWIVEGIVALVQSGDSGSRGWSIFFGILSLIAGIILLFSPLWGAVVLFWVAGISLIVLGIIQIVRAFAFGRGVATA